MTRRTLTVAVRLGHVAVPFLIGRYLRSRAEHVTSHRSAGVKADPQALYDASTVLLATAALRGRDRIWQYVTAAPALLWAASRSAGVPAQHPVQVVGVAAAEELVWRAEPTWQLPSVVGFAAMHAGQRANAWPYHLLTGSMLLAVRSRWGLIPTVAVHTAHNLYLAHRDGSAGASSESEHPNSTPRPEMPARRVSQPW